MLRCVCALGVTVVLTLASCGSALPAERSEPPPPSPACPAGYRQLGSHESRIEFLGSEPVHLGPKQCLDLLAPPEQHCVAVSEAAEAEANDRKRGRKPYLDCVEQAYYGPNGAQGGDSVGNRGNGSCKQNCQGGGGSADSCSNLATKTLAPSTPAFASRGRARSR